MVRCAVLVVASSFLMAIGCGRDSATPAAPQEKTSATSITSSQQATTPALEKEIWLDLNGGVKLELVLIPAGEFLMGSPDSDVDAQRDEKPQHRVQITKPFYMGKYPVTQEQWEAVEGGNPSNFKGPKNPVENVNWHDCLLFLASLDVKYGNRYGAFNLPTEAQWEYSCRAGSTTRYCFGDEESGLDEYAWYNRNSGGKTHPVGERKPNAWGLYDMHGNVLEWCRDSSGKYRAGLLTDNQREPWEGLDRMIRGGSQGAPARHCRSAARIHFVPESRSNDLGFRVSVVPADK